MASVTSDVYLKPEDGWKLIATDPATIFLRPSSFVPWQLAISAAAPADGIKGIPLGRNKDPFNFFRSDVAITGGVYIKIDQPPNGNQPFNAAAQSGAMHFGLIVS